MDYELIEDIEGLEELAKAVSNVKGKFASHGFGPVPVKDVIAKRLSDYLWNCHITDKPGTFYDMVYRHDGEDV